MSECRVPVLGCGARVQRAARRAPTSQQPRTGSVSAVRTSNKPVFFVISTDGQLVKNVTPSPLGRCATVLDGWRATPEKLQMPHDSRTSVLSETKLYVGSTDILNVFLRRQIGDTCSYYSAASSDIVIAPVYGALFEDSLNTRVDTIVTELQVLSAECEQLDQTFKQLPMHCERSLLALHEFAPVLRALP